MVAQTFELTVFSKIVDVALCAILLLSIENPVPRIVKLAFTITFLYVALAIDKLGITHFLCAVDTTVKVVPSFVARTCAVLISSPCAQTVPITL